LSAVQLVQRIALIEVASAAEAFALAAHFEAVGERLAEGRWSA
jgi:hypothetical protein